MKELYVALLPAETVRVSHCHAVDASGDQGILHLFEHERFYDCFDHFHLLFLSARLRDAEIGIGNNRHFALIEAFKLDFLGDPQWDHLVQNLEKHIHHAKNKHKVHDNADDLSRELRSASIKQP